jgi:hypothetical protein
MALTIAFEPDHHAQVKMLAAQEGALATGQISTRLHPRTHKLLRWPGERATANGRVVVAVDFTI